MQTVTGNSRIAKASLSIAVLALLVGLALPFRRASR